MKLLNPIRLSVGLAALLVTQAGWAGGTDAGTPVLNTATLSYSVGSQAQTPIDSNQATFLVDKKIDLIVTGDSTDPIEVNPSTSGNELNYTFKNEGNSAQDFLFELSHLGLSDDQFDAGVLGATTTTPLINACTYTIKDAGVAMPAATDVPIATATTLTAVAKDKELTITVTCDMPHKPDVNNTDLSIIDVKATALEGGVAATETGDTDGSDRKDVMDIVLADGKGQDIDTKTADDSVRNAIHSAIQTFEIVSPELSVAKTSAVISDPVNCPTAAPVGNANYADFTDTEALAATACANDPKRIPGAVIEYTITITNASETAPDPVTITDIIDTDGAVGGTNTVTFVPGSIVINGTPATAANSSFNDPTVEATSVVVPAASGATPGTATVTFRVTID